MSYQIILLSIIAVLNSFFSYFILQGEKNKTNILFSLVTLSVALWAVNLAFFIGTKDLERALFFANNYYVAAAAIPLLFFYFSVFFPKKESRRWEFRHSLYLLPFFFLTGAILLGERTILEEVRFGEFYKEVTIHKGFYLLYAFYFLFFVALSYYHLGKSWRATRSALEKIQLKLIVVGTLVSYLLGMAFNLVLPFLGNYEDIWLGPVFTLIMIFAIGYAVLKHHLFDIKVIAAELFTFALWFFILIRTLVSESLEEQLMNGALLFATIVLGIFLIRSVIKEVRTRERIELLAKDLERANVRLKELDQQKSEFVSIASHQLRSPLTAIKGYASMLLEGSFGTVEPKARGAVERVYESSRHLTAVVEDLLNVTKIELGGMQFEFSKVDLRKMVTDIAADLAPNIERAKLRVAVGDNGHRTYHVNADYEKLRQVVANLIDNAVKYTPKGEISVFLNEDDSAGKTTLSVKDSGLGIPKELLGRLFEKFSRGAGISKVNTGGSGLGLYVAKEIVKAHGGRIWAESGGEGRGSTFFVELDEYEHAERTKRTENFAQEL